MTGGSAAASRLRSGTHYDATHRTYAPRYRPHHGRIRHLRYHGMYARGMARCAEHGPRKRKTVDNIDDNGLLQLYRAAELAVCVESRQPAGIGLCLRGHRTTSMTQQQSPTSSAQQRRAVRRNFRDDRTRYRIPWYVRSWRTIYVLIWNGSFSMISPCSSTKRAQG